MTQEPKSRYCYRMRPLSDPPELVEFEAGPFTPLDASLYGQSEAAKRCMLTGRPWVCDYGPISEPPPLPSASPLRLAMVAMLLTLLSAGIGVMWRLAVRADETCRERATLSPNVTLCRGETYATNVWGEIECGCRAP